MTDQLFRRRSGESNPIVFRGGVYLAKNTSRLSSVRAQRVRAERCKPFSTQSPEKRVCVDFNYPSTTSRLMVALTS